MFMHFRLKQDSYREVKSFYNIRFLLIARVMQLMKQIQDHEINMLHLLRIGKVRRLLHVH